MSRLLLNIITPCTQIDNLKLLHESIVAAKKELPIDIRWHIVFDTMTDVRVEDIKSSDITISISYAGDKESVSGSAQINHALDHIKEGFVHILKENNLLHPEILDYLYSSTKLCCPKAPNDKPLGLLVEQYLEDDEIRPIKVLPSFIDCAQFIIHSSLINGLRFHLGISSADGIFIQQIYNKHYKKFHHVDKPLSYLKKVEEHRLLEKAPESFGVGSLVTINRENFDNIFSKVETYMIQGTIMKLRRQLSRKLIITNIIEEKGVCLVVILPPRKSNIAWRHGKGTVLKFETLEQAKNVFSLVE